MPGIVTHVSPRAGIHTHRYEGHNLWHTVFEKKISAVTDVLQKLSTITFLTSAPKPKYALIDDFNLFNNWKIRITRFGTLRDLRIALIAVDINSK